MRPTLITLQVLEKLTYFVTLKVINIIYY